MLRTILVPLDGTPLAESALPHAVAITKQTGARIVLVRTAWASENVIDIEAAKLLEVSRAECYLHQLARQLTQDGIPTAITVPYDHPAHGILAEASLRRVDLIVMAIRSHRASGAASGTSIASTVLSSSRPPVLLVKHGATESECSTWKKPPRLLVVLNKTAATDDVLPRATALAQALGGTIIVMCVLPSSPSHGSRGTVISGFGDVDSDSRRWWAESEILLGETTDRIARHGVPAEFVLAVGPVLESILETIKSRHITLVALASDVDQGTSRPKFDHLVTQILERAAVPVLTVGPAAD